MVSDAERLSRKMEKNNKRKAKGHLENIDLDGVKMLSLAICSITIATIVLLSLCLYASYQPKEEPTTPGEVPFITDDITFIGNESTVDLAHRHHISTCYNGDLQRAYTYIKSRSSSVIAISTHQSITTIVWNEYTLH